MSEKECVTHHFACDCRERKFTESLEMIANLEQANANCISLSLHESRMSNLQKELDTVIEIGVEGQREINRKLSEQNKELVWFSEKMNKYVLPGECDSQDSALKVFKELSEENKRLKVYETMYLRSLE